MTETTFYIFHGDDDLQIEQKVNDMRAKMGTSTEALMNINEFDGETSSAGEVLAAAGSYPFLADKRLVIVKGLLAWITRKGAGETGKKAVEMLLAELPELPDYARLVFVEREKLSDKNKILKLAQDHERGYQKAFDLPKDATTWILKRARQEYDADMQPAAAAALSSVIGDDLRRADNEIAKLVTYVGEGQPITEADVAALTPYVAEASLFEMVDALAEGRGQQAMTLLHRLLDDKEDAFGVYAMVIRQFRLLLLAKEYLTTGGTPGGIKEALGVHSFVAEKLARQTRSFTVVELERVYRALLDYDLKMKTGRIKTDLALDMLIASLSTR